MVSETQPAAPPAAATAPSVAHASGPRVGAAPRRDSCQTIKETTAPAARQPPTDRHNAPIETCHPGWKRPAAGRDDELIAGAAPVELTRLTDSHRGSPHSVRVASILNRPGEVQPVNCRDQNPVDSAKAATAATRNTGTIRIARAADWRAGAA